MPLGRIVTLHAPRSTQGVPRMAKIRLAHDSRTNQANGPGNFNSKGQNMAPSTSTRSSAVKNKDPAPTKNKSKKKS